MKTMFRVLTAAVVSLMMVSAFAQPGGAGGGRQGGGRGGQFGMQGRMGGGTMSKLQLVNRADVQRDIKATDEQKQKFEALNAQMREEMQGMMGGGPGAGGPGGGGGGGQRDPQAMQAMRDQMMMLNAKYDAEVDKVLDAAQIKRVGEIKVQLLGKRAILDPGIQKDLKMTDAQKAQIKNLQDANQEAQRDLMQQARDSGADMQAVQDERQRLQDDLDAKLAKVLTDEQTKQLEAMKGEKFKADAQQPRGGRGGGGN